jgi:type II secretory pathway pseudopilin PulG
VTRRDPSGYTLVALLASVAIMLILMAAAVPSWRYVMKNDREEELIFRGGEIADAIARYQQKNGNALPPSLEVLVKGHFLRREYKDPMTKHGRWRFIRQGEALGPIRAPGTPGGTGTTTTTTTTTTRPSAFTSPTGAGGTLGGIQGVASTSTETSLRVFNGRTKYNEWLFLPGQPRIIGRPQRRPGPVGAPGQPGGVPGRPGQPGGVPGRPGQPTLPQPPGVRR